MEAEKKEKMNKMRERERERVIKEDDERVPEGDGVEMREETKAQEGRWSSLKANQRNDSPLPAS